MMANQNQQKVPDLVPINGSTNVYVGQRYVPKFYDDGTEQHGATWDKTKMYEPLTIVLWEGDSYTSRTFVPAGVEITDTQYWLPTGLFNAQLQSYINQVNNLNDSLNKNISLMSSPKRRYSSGKYVIVADAYTKPILDAFAYPIKNSYVGTYNIGDGSLKALFQSFVPDDTVTCVIIMGMNHNSASISGETVEAFHNVAINKFPSALISYTPILDSKNFQNYWQMIKSLSVRCVNWQCLNYSMLTGTAVMDGAELTSTFINDCMWLSAQAIQGVPSIAPCFTAEYDLSTKYGTIHIHGVTSKTRSHMNFFSTSFGTGIPDYTQEIALGTVTLNGMYAQNYIMDCEWNSGNNYGIGIIYLRLANKDAGTFSATCTLYGYTASSSALYIKPLTGNLEIPAYT